MAYIGQIPTGLYTTTNAKDTFSGDDTTVSFTLSQAGTTNNVDVFVENVRQEPVVAYTVDGTTITFTSAPTTGTNNIYVVNRGPAELSASHPASQALEAYSGNFTTDVTVGGAFDATTATFDRASTDGTIIDLQKDGTTVGSIGVAGTGIRPYYAGNNVGISPYNNVIYPTNGSGAAVDNTNDFGASSYRFKDLYLGGGVYVGGTGAANHLDDYEEGTWTPTINVGSATNLYANYTKIGRQVFLSGNLADITDYTTLGDLIISGLPYSAASGTVAVGSVMVRYVNTGGYEQVNSYIGQGANSLAFYMSDTTSNASWNVLEYKDANQPWDMIFSIVYIAA